MIFSPYFLFPSEAKSPDIGKAYVILILLALENERFLVYRLPQ